MISAHLVFFFWMEMMHKSMYIGYHIGLPILFLLLVLYHNHFFQQHFDHIIETTRTTTRRIKKKLDPKGELSILNFQNLFCPFLFVMLCDYLLFLNNLKVSFKFFCSWPSESFLHKSLHLDNRILVFILFIL